MCENRNDNNTMMPAYSTVDAMVLAGIAAGLIGQDTIGFDIQPVPLFPTA